MIACFPTDAADAAVIDGMERGADIIDVTTAKPMVLLSGVLKTGCPFNGLPNKLGSAPTMFFPMIGATTTGGV